MSNQDGSDDHKEAAHLAHLNYELVKSLNRCRKLLFDCRSQLAANCNLPELLDEDDDKLLG